MRTGQSSLIASPAMEAARALADLTEISPQIEAAVVFDRDGRPQGFVGLSEQSAQRVAHAGRALLAGAAETPGDHARVTQLHASLGAGDIFTVAADERAIVAVASKPQAPGLVFYDLKRCLAAVGEPEPPAAEPQRRRRFGRRRHGEA
jgi:hypothetical protein